MSDERENQAVLANPISLKLGEREFLLAPLGPNDQGKIFELCRKLARAECKSPLQSVMEMADKLPTELKTLAIREAISLGGTKVAEPTQDAIVAKITTVELVRYQLWLSAQKTEPTLKLDDVAKLVDDENRWEVITALAGANSLQVNGDPKATGPAGS